MELLRNREEFRAYGRRWGAILAPALLLALVFLLLATFTMETVPAGCEQISENVQQCQDERTMMGDTSRTLVILGSVLLGVTLILGLRAASHIWNSLGALFP